MCNCARAVCAITLQVVNIIFLLLGLAVVGAALAAYIIIDDDIDSDLLGDLDFILVGLMVLGGIITFLSICGCVGAKKGHKGCLCFYTISLSIIFLLELALLIWMVVYYADAEDKLRDSWVEECGSDSGVNRLVKLQDKYDCCGWDDTNKTITACVEVIAQCNATNIGTYCADDVTDSVEDNLLYLIYMTSILVAAELVLLAMSACVMGRKDEDYEQL